MARADLLKQLFKGYQSRDDQAFRQAAEEIILEERRKHHIVVADELARLLSSPNGYFRHGDFGSVFSPPPEDPDRKAPLLQIRRPDRYLSDLVLTRELQQSLLRTMNEFRNWEVLETHGLRPVRHILFCGPPGCGKTAAAEALASELGLPLLYVRFDSVVSSLLGETSANLRRVFDYAERGQWVVIFDEFDAIGRSRDDITEHGEIKRVVNSYLQMMDNFRGRSLVIAATNFEASLDPAIWRRFDDVLRFERPNRVQIGAMIRLRLKPLSFSDSDVESIVSRMDGTAFSDVERVCLDIRKSLAIEGEHRVEPRHIREAIQRWTERRRVLSRVELSGEISVDRE